MTLQPEFQAVVLAAGKGSRITEITTGKPKCLLPVGSKPLIWYPLNNLQQAGFTEVIVVVLENQKSEIQTVLDKCDLEIKIEFFTISASEDLGTADSLRLIQDRLKSDVVVVSCDLITDESLKGVLNLFRMHNASLACLLFESPPPQESILVPGPKSKYKPERDLIGIDAQTNRMVFLASASDFESELSLPKALFKKHTNIKMYSSLIDSHVYIMKNWIIPYLANENHFTTLKGELLPHIIKKQLAKPSKLIENKSVATKNGSDDIFSFCKDDEFDRLIRNASSYNDHIGDSKETYHGDNIRCYGFIAPSNTFGIRVNTLPSYWKINNKINESWLKLSGGKEFITQHPKSEILSNQVDNKCIIWEGAKLYEKTSFKNAIIGCNSEVHSFSRVFNSIVMNNVVIKQKVAIENCIICDGAIIETGCVIKGCLVGSNHTVPANSEYNFEVLTESDRLMEF